MINRIILVFCVFYVSTANCQDTSLLRNGIFVNNNDTFSITINHPVKHLYFYEFDSFDLKNKLVYGSFRVEDKDIEYIFISYDTKEHTLKKYRIFNSTVEIEDLNQFFVDTININFLFLTQNEYRTYCINRFRTNCSHLVINFILSKDFKLLFISDDYSHKELYNYYLDLISEKLPKVDF